MQPVGALGLPSRERSRAAVFLLAVALLSAHATARASEPAGVVVSAAESSSPVVKEAVVRAQGELSAVGLSAAVESTDEGRGARRLPRGVYGLLELVQRGSELTIHAWAPRARHSIDARVDLSAPGVTAEVIAVRAVETLRAAMLEFAQGERGEVPAAVRGFTRFAPEPQREAPVVRAPSSPPALAPLAFWLGPTLSLHAGASPDLGVQLGALVGQRFGFVAAAFESTVSDLEVEGEHGVAHVTRRAVWAQLGARLRPARSFEITTRAGVGYAWFGIEGDGEPGFRGITTTHGSMALMLGVSGAYWATRAFGLYASVGFRLATAAPVVRIADEDALTLDRPSFVVSLGTSVGVF